NKPGSASLKPGSSSAQQHRHAAGPRAGVVRISASLGEVKLNVHRVTHGLARNSGAATGTRANRDNTTVWGSGDSGSASSTSVQNVASSGGAAGAAAAASGGASSAASTAAAIVGGANGGGNGNGNNGNGNGNTGVAGNNGNHGNGNNGNHNGQIKH